MMPADHGRTVRQWKGCGFQTSLVRLKGRLSMSTMQRRLPSGLGQWIELEAGR